MPKVFDKRLKYVGIDLEILGNGKNICEISQIYGSRLKYLIYVDLSEMAKIYGKWLNYLTNGLNIWELTQRFWEMAKRFVKWLRYMGHSLSI